MVSVNFIFTPIETFDTLVFELQRNEDDYNSPRIPRILFRELNIVNNVLDTLTGGSKPIVKFGIQGTPGLKMCINNEEIQIGRTGVYEIKNGVLEIKFFSVVNVSKFNVIDNVTLETLRNSALETESGLIAINRNQPYVIDDFIMDYIY